MARVKRGTKRRARRKKYARRTKGFFLTKSKLYQSMQEAANRADRYAYRDRRNRKRQYRRLWIQRIGAAARLSGLSYSELMHGLKSLGLDIDRKMLAELAVKDAAGFAALQLAPRLGQGRYTLEIDYSASVDGDPNIAAIDIGYLNEKLLYSGSLRADTNRLRAQFSVPHEGRRLRMRLFFAGFGALDVRRITLRRDSGI